MSQHTKEPWSLRGNEIGKRVISDDQSNGMMLSIAFADKYDFEGVWEANARRIVACVNACAGISNEVLDLHAGDNINILAANTALGEKMKAFSAQRDDLLAAMQRYLPFIPTSSAKDGGAASHSEYVKAADQFREAIAKAVQP